MQNDHLVIFLTFLKRLFCFGSFVIVDVARLLVMFILVVVVVVLLFYVHDKHQRSCRNGQLT